MQGTSSVVSLCPEHPTTTVPFTNELKCSPCNIACFLLAYVSVLLFYEKPNPHSHLIL